jgi:hypothetical protein
MKIADKGAGRFVRSDWPMRTRRKYSQLQIVARNTNEFGGPPTICFGDMSPGRYANDLALLEHVPIRLLMFAEPRSQLLRVSQLSTTSRARRGVS